MDWKEQLSNLRFEASASGDEPESQAPAEPSAAASASPARKQVLCLRFEKRNGKPATIVSEFEGSAEELKDLARKLKNTLGTGGSAKDDEILLQGDVRQKVSQLLRAEGYRLKGEVK